MTIQKWLQDPNFHHIFKIYILSLKWANNFNPYKQYTPKKVKISRLSKTLRYKYIACIKLKMWFASFEQGQNYCVQFDLYECHCPHEQLSQLPLKLTRIKVLHHKRSEECLNPNIYQYWQHFCMCIHVNMYYYKPTFNRDDIISRFYWI